MNNNNIFDISCIWSDTAETINYLQDHRLLKTNHRCCGVRCSLVKSHSKDAKEFKCYRCKKRYSIRTGSFFYRSKLSLPSLLSLLYFFCMGIGLVECRRLLKGKVSKNCILQWFVYLREVCSLYLLQNNTQLGGRGRFVEIDECAIGHKRKFNRGFVRGSGTKWIFGIIDVTSKKCHIQWVPDRTRDTLYPIIRQHIAVGSCIHSDEATVYRTLGQQNYEHRTVCHKDNYVNPMDGTHTNNIENFWAHLKNYIKGIQGVNIQNLPLHLDEYMYCWNRKNEGDLFLSCSCKILLILILFKVK